MKIRSVVGVLLLGLVGSTANASLIGDTVTTRYFGNGEDTGAIADVVGAGEEGDFFFNQYFDYDAFSFTIRSQGDWCGVFACDTSLVSLELADLDFGAPLTDVNFSTNLVGVNMSFTADSVLFSWIEQAITSGTYLSADFSIGTTSVPEPMTLSLLGLGLAGIAASRRRSKA